jgi:hypothetical protein
MKTGSVARWREWARSLAALRRAGGRGRNAAVNRRRGPLALALARRARLSAWIHLHNHVHNWVRGQRRAPADAVAVQPLIQFALTFGSPLGRILQRAPAASAEQTPDHRSELSRDGVASPGLETFHATFRSARTTLREIVERTRRIEESERVVTRLVSRGQAIEAGAAARPASKPSPQALSGEWWQPEPESARYRPPTPAVNVDQIADTVLRQLDRRVGAWRERMGRN